MEYLQYSKLQLTTDELSLNQHVDTAHTSEPREHRVSVAHHKLHYPGSIRRLNTALDTICALDLRETFTGGGLVTLALQHGHHISYAVKPLTSDGYQWLIALALTVEAEQDALILLIPGLRAKTWKGSYVERSCAAFTLPDRSEGADAVIDQFAWAIERYYLEKCRLRIKAMRSLPPIAALLQNDQVRRRRGW